MEKFDILSYDMVSQAYTLKKQQTRRLNVFGCVE